NYNGKKARQGDFERRRALGRRLGGDARTVLEGTARGFARETRAGGSVRSLLYRWSGQGTAQGNLQTGRSTASRGLPEPGDCEGHYDGRKDDGESWRSAAEENRREGLAHYLLHCVVQFPGSGVWKLRSGKKGAEPGRSGERRHATVEADAGRSREAGDPSKSFGADCGAASGAGGTRSHQRKSGPAAAGATAGVRRGSTIEHRGATRSKDSRVSAAYRADPNLQCGAGVWDAGFRPFALAEVPGGAIHGECGESEQPFDARTGDFAGGFAVHRLAARAGERGSVQIARATGAGALRPGGGLAEGRRGDGNRHAARKRGAAKRKAAADRGDQRPGILALRAEPAAESGSQAANRVGGRVELL